MNADEEPQGSFGTAAYGGVNWSQRKASHAEDIGQIWTSCGIECLTCATDELSRAAGNVGCLTAVLQREQSA